MTHEQTTSSARTLRGNARPTTLDPPHIPGSPIRRHAASLLATAVLPGIVLAGCTLTAPEDATPVETSTHAEQDAAPPAVGDPSPRATSPADPTEPPDRSDEQPGRDCTDVQRTELTAAVDGQLDAIAARDWEQALAFATDDFRADIDPDRFRDIILEGFPVVADAHARDVGRCLVDELQATLVVTVEDRDGAQQPLLYLFEHDGDGWSIGGAVPPAGRDGGSDPPTINA